MWMSSSLRNLTFVIRGQVVVENKRKRSGEGEMVCGRLTREADPVCHRISLCALLYEIISLKEQTSLSTTRSQQDALSVEVYRRLSMVHQKKKKSRVREQGSQVARSVNVVSYISPTHRREPEMVLFGLRLEPTWI